MKYLISMIFVISTFSLLSILPMNSSLATDNINCETDHAYADEIENGIYEFDLLCKPVMMDTLEIAANDYITVIINVENYYEALEVDQAEFYLHFAMQRARIMIREEGAIGGEELVDARGALQSLRLTTSDDSYTVIIENRGMRSAIFDLTLRLN